MKPSAIILRMPREPPVTSAVRPFREKRSLVSMAPSYHRARLAAWDLLQPIELARVIAQHHARELERLRARDLAVADHAGQRAHQRFAPVVGGDESGLIPSQLPRRRIGLNGE